MKPLRRRLNRYKKAAAFTAILALSCACSPKATPPMLGASASSNCQTFHQTDCDWVGASDGVVIGTVLSVHISYEPFLFRDGESVLLRPTADGCHPTALSPEVSVTLLPERVYAGANTLDVELLTPIEIVIPGARTRGMSPTPYRNSSGTDWYPEPAFRLGAEYGFSLMQIAEGRFSLGSGGNVFTVDGARLDFGNPSGCPAPPKDLYETELGTSACPESDLSTQAHERSQTHVAQGFQFREFAWCANSPIEE